MGMQNRVGARLRAARAALGWTQADLSHHSRLSTGDISRIECGRLIPTESQLRRLEEALGLANENNAEALAR